MFCFVIHFHLLLRMQARSGHCMIIGSATEYIFCVLCACVSVHNGTNLYIDFQSTNFLSARSCVLTVAAFLFERKQMTRD